MQLGQTEDLTHHAFSLLSAFWGDDFDSDLRDDTSQGEFVGSENGSKGTSTDKLAQPIPAVDHLSQKVVRRRHALSPTPLTRAKVRQAASGQHEL
jgi:hypothetical protein